MQTIGILWTVACSIVLTQASGASIPAQNASAEGFRSFYNLDYDAAIASFEQALAAEPNDPEMHNHLSQALLYRELNRNGALEGQIVSGNNSFLRRAKLNPSAAVEKQFFGEVDRALQLSQALVAKNNRDTFALHAAAVARGLRANYNFLVRKAWKEALSDATEARKLDTKVLEIDPSFVDAKLILGAHDYVVGSLSWAYRTLGFLAGFRGDKVRGIHEVEEVYRNGKTSRVDAQILLCVLYRREGETKRALPLLDDLIRHYPQNYLFRFEQAQMYSVIGDRPRCIAALDEVIALKQANAPGYNRAPWDRIWFQKGNLHFWFNELDAAMENLKKVTADPKDLDLNTGVLAYMRQGQIYDLKKQHGLAMKQYELAMSFAPEADAARESKHYMNNPYDRNSKWRP